MKVFSFRAECWHDITQFFAACQDAEIAVYGHTIGPAASADSAIFVMPDLVAQFHSEDSVTVEQLQRVIAGIPDLHVISETLRPVTLAENSLERRR